MGEYSCWKLKYLVLSTVESKFWITGGITVDGLNMLKLFLADKMRIDKIYWAMKWWSQAQTLCKPSQSGEKVRSPWDSIEKLTNNNLSIHGNIFIVKPLFLLHPVVFKLFLLIWVLTLNPLVRVQDLFCTFWAITMSITHVYLRLLTQLTCQLGKPLADDAVWKAWDHVTWNVIPITSCSIGKMVWVPTHPHMPAWFSRFSTGFLWSPVRVDWNRVI